MTWSRPCDAAQAAGTAMLGSQKLFSPYCSTVGIICVQLPGDSDLPTMPRYSKQDCGCSVVRATVSPPTWKSVTLSDADGAEPPQGEAPSLLMFCPRGGGTVMAKWAEASGHRARLSRAMGLRRAMVCDWEGDGVPRSELALG